VLPLPENPKLSLVPGVAAEGLTTVFVIPTSSRESCQLIAGLHEAFLFGAFTIICRLCSTASKNSDGRDETEQKDINLG